MVTIGIDGGGLDDLLGLAVLGRCKVTRDWLLWTHAWCQEDVLELRKDIAERLTDFERAGDLTLCSDATQDVQDVADIVERIWKPICCRRRMASASIRPALRRSSMRSSRGSIPDDLLRGVTRQGRQHAAGDPRHRAQAEERHVLAWRDAA